MAVYIGPAGDAQIRGGPWRGSPASFQTANPWQTFKEAWGPAGIRNKARNVQNWMRGGPLNNWAMERAFNAPTIQQEWKGLSRVAGRQSLYSRVFSGPAHQTGMNWTRDMLGTGMGGVGGSGFSRAGKIAEPKFGELVEQGMGRGLSKSAARRGAAWSIAGRTVFKAIGPAFLAYAGYEGYKKEGAWGAVKGVGGALAETYLVGRAISAFGAPALGVLGAAAGASVLGAIAHDPDAFLSMKGWVRPWTSEYHKKTQGVQMGGEVVDPHGINATMRQRSMLAIQNSRMNARSGLGQEATLTFSPYFS